MRRFATATRFFAFAGLSAGLVFAASADTHTTGTPQLNSRAGAAYTLYLDFAGFNFTGTWGNSGQMPGNTNAYFDQTGSFTAAQQAAISNVWARVAEAYSSFNVNVTTVDPAVAAGQADTDAHRQAYYDSTAKLMHTVIGGSGSWSGGGGVSYVGTTQNSYDPTVSNGGAGAGWHENWIFAAQAPNNFAFVSEASAHENGHGLSLYHQSDYSGNTKTSEYSSNGGSTGNGSFAPIMGNSYSSQRGLWRVGASSGANNVKVTQDDMVGLLSNNGIGGFMDDGIGHTLANATNLALNGTNVDYTLAKGNLTPNSTSAPNPMGESNYTTDYFKFYSGGGTVTLVAHDGGELLTPGTADPGAMLDSVLRIYDANGNLVGSATRDASTLFETFTGTLASGAYYAQVADFGGYTGTNDSTAHYYTNGSYFLTGSGFAAVPEPATIAGLALGAIALLRRRKNRA